MDTKTADTVEQAYRIRFWRHAAPVVARRIDRQYATAYATVLNGL
jgi:hypothetical protein